MREPLSAEAIGAALKDLPGWTYENGRLRKTYKLKDFREAVSFIVRLGFEAEALDHHPELTNVYNSVSLALATHDAGDKVTEMDLKLAKAVERISNV